MCYVSACKPEKIVHIISVLGIGVKLSMGVANAETSSVHGTGVRVNVVVVTMKTYTKVECKKGSTFILHVVHLFT